MAQTWPPNKWKVALLSLIDSVGRPLARVAGRDVGPIPAGEVKSILVVELWQIGDVVLTTPFLGALRKYFPSARISFLGKSHAAELLAESGLVDEVIIAEIPWTRQRKKYSARTYSWKTLTDLIGNLRAHRFDVAFDARMDIRSNILVSLSGARRRVGFRYGGGDWLLTDAVPVNPQVKHKVEDWLALLSVAGCERPTHAGCLLRITEVERAAARRSLAAAFADGGPLVALHPGGSHAGKRWPIESFVTLAEELVSRGLDVVAFVDPSGCGAELSAVAGVATFSPTIREMMGLIEHCAALICNDSGPMHVAAALGVPTVAIFERGEPRWFGPVGEGHIVLSGELAGVAVSAVPESNPPKNPVTVDRVLEATLSQLQGKGTQTSAVPGIIFDRAKRDSTNR